MKSTYRTINIKSESLIKEKQSKFYGYAFPISDIESVKSSIDSLKKTHYSARHFCYAYQIGLQDLAYRVNDDGEPRNSAGIPIYGQIQSFDLTNILIVVVRYFGGTKLGVGGLVSAYKECAKLTIESNTIITKEITIKIQIKFDYLLMNKVMRVIKEHNLKVLTQQMHTSCVFELLTTRQNNDIVCGQFNRHLGIVISIK